MPDDSLDRVTFTAPGGTGKNLMAMSHDLRMNRSQLILSLVLPAIEKWQLKNRLANARPKLKR